VTGSVRSGEREGKVLSTKREKILTGNIAPKTSTEICAVRAVLPSCRKLRTWN